MRELENEGIRKKGTSYKLAPAEARNINNTTKENGRGGLFRRVG